MTAVITGIRLARAVTAGFDHTRSGRRAQLWRVSTERRQTSRQRAVPLPTIETEATFQAQVVELFRTCGWSSYHTYDARRSNPGYPDLTLWHPRRGIIWLELKSRTGRVSPEQQRMIDELNVAAGREVAWIVRPSDWPFVAGLASTPHRYG